MKRYSFEINFDKDENGASYDTIVPKEDVNGEYVRYSDIQHMTDRLAWRWNGNYIYVGKLKVCWIEPCGNTQYVATEYTLDDYYMLGKSDGELRQACEKIADEFIKSLTTKL